MLEDFKSEELRKLSHDLETPNERQPLIEELLGSEDGSDEQEIQLGLMSVF